MPALGDDFHVVLPDALAASGHHAAVTVRGGDEQGTFAQGQRFRFLAENVLAGTAGLQNDERMPVVRGGDVHCVNVVPGQYLPEVAVGFAVGVAIMLVHAVFGAVADAFADVAHGHVLHVRLVEEDAEVAPTHVAEADTGHDNPLAGWRRLLVAADGRGQDGGEANGGGR